MLDSKENRASSGPNDFYAEGPLRPLDGLAGHKGFCLAFLSDLPGGILTPNPLPGGTGKQSSNSTLIMAIDIERFAPLAT